MTPTDNDMTIIRPLAALHLTVRDPSGQIRRMPLASGRLLIGRGEDNALVLQADDQAASRRHAIITVDGPVVAVEDAGSTNGVFVNEVKVQRAMLRPGDVVRLGRTVLTVEATAPHAAPGPSPGPAGQGKRPSRRLILYAALLAAVCAVLTLAVLSGDDDPAPPPDARTEPASPGQAPAGDAPAPDTAPAPPGEPPAPDPAAATPADPAPAATGTPAGPKDAPASEPVPAAPAVAQQPAASPEAVEKSQEHGRQAMFFYNSGKIGLAISEWEKAVTLDPGNSQAAKWLARAEGERDHLLDKHYREGLASLKYSRRDEAVANFRFVVEHCREKSDERCLDATRHLEELEGKKP